MTISRSRRFASREGIVSAASRREQRAMTLTLHAVAGGDDTDLRQRQRWIPLCHQFGQTLGWQREDQFVVVAAGECVVDCSVCVEQLTHGGGWRQRIDVEPRAAMAGNTEFLQIGQQAI